jgi:hypothetical protein
MEKERQDYFAALLDRKGSKNCLQKFLDELKAI